MSGVDKQPTSDKSAFGWSIMIVPPIFRAELCGVTLWPAAHSLSIMFAVERYETAVGLCSGLAMPAPILSHPPTLLSDRSGQRVPPELLETPMSAPYQSWIL